MFGHHIGWMRTLLLAGALGGVAYFGIPAVEQGGASQTPTSTLPTVATAPATVGEQERSVRLGVPVPAMMQDRAFLLALPKGTITEARVPAGWRTAALEREGGTLTSLQDGAFKLTTTEGWSAVLRQKNGEPYREASVLCHLNETQVAVLAVADTRVVLSVGKTGEVRSLGALTEFMEPVGCSGGSVWLATFQPGEGLESPPTGPSNLHRLGLDAQMAPVLSDSDVIVRVVARSSTVFAYRMESGGFVARTADARFRAEGIPLVWLDDQRLLFAQGVTLSVADVPRATSTQVGTMPLSPGVAVLE